MKILALEPYYGGSHRAFLDGWSANSRHGWTVLGLPAYKWKWRMRHAAVTLLDPVCQRLQAGESWDLLFCSDMLNLAEFLGLAPRPVQQLPSVVYFHENQLTYPVQHEAERDYHFALSNMTTALAATSVWFNSAFHRDSFLEALPTFLKRMPDHQPFDAGDRIRTKARIESPGIHPFPARDARRPGEMRVLWAARWEYDKDPDTFFDALERLKSLTIPFRLSVIGERFRQSPPVFDWAEAHFRDHVDRWGYQETREQYESALLDADVVVSTAKHEFFGISVVEAIAAGAYPLLPKRLAYPEILGLDEADRAREFFYEGGGARLAARLAALADRVARDDLWAGDPDRAVRMVTRFSWDQRAPQLDDGLDALMT
jgi:glycosyltransferase involved in cell wall biosynthesis